MARTYPKLYEPRYPRKECRLDERDYRLLEIVGIAKLATSTQLCLLLKDFVGEPIRKDKERSGAVIMKDARRLFDYGYIAKPQFQRALRGLNGNIETIYSLSGKGAAALKLWYSDQGQDDTTPPTLYRPGPTNQTRHRLLIAHTRVLLTLATKQHPLWTLTGWLDTRDRIEHTLSASYPELSRRPDVVCQLSSQTRTITLFIECDCTVNPARMAERYIEFLTYAQDAHVLTMSQNQRRYEALQRAITSLPEQLEHLLLPDQKKKKEDSIASLLSKLHFTWQGQHSLEDPQTILGHFGPRVFVKTASQ